MEELQTILALLIIFGSLFGSLYIFLSSRNKERMAMIESGVNPKDFIIQRKVSAYSILKWALLLAGVGLGLFFGSILEAYTNIDEEPAYFACALLFGGLGLLLAFLMTKKYEEKQPD